jgi:hypothetical protein
MSGQIREEFRRLLESTYVSSMDNGEAIFSKMMAFYTSIISMIPEKLYRYRRVDNDGYAIKSFEEKTITLCRPSCFPDKYDSLIYIDNHAVKENLVRYFKEAMSCIIKEIIRKNPNVRSEKAAKVCYYFECGLNEQQVVDKVVQEEYSDYIIEIEKKLKEREPRFRCSDRTARIACFTESVQSKFMWDAYAGGYTGFALEYNLRDYFINSLQKQRQVYVMPIIYSDEKVDLTAEESNFFFMEECATQIEMSPLIPIAKAIPHNLLTPHKPFLYKDKNEYEHEREWRMLYYEPELNENYVSIPDDGFLNAIYYGPDINPSIKKDLRRIAQKQEIKEYDVSLDTDSRKYQLKVKEIEWLG